MTALLERAKLIGKSAPEGEPAEQLGDQLGDVIELDRDPEPGRRTRRRPRAEQPAATSSARKSPARSGGKFTSREQVRKGIEDEINMYAKMLALTWSMTDPGCGEVLNETSANIARDLAALAARSEWIVERFETTSLFADIAKLLHSLLPLARAVYTHHVAGRRDQDDQGEGERVTVATDYQPYQPYSPFRPSAG